MSRRLALVPVIAIAAMVIALAALALAIAIATGAIDGRDHPAQPAPKPCRDVLMPGMILTHETVDRGCIDPNGYHQTGATYRCYDGRRLFANGFNVWGFVGEPLVRGDGTLNDYGRKVSGCFSR